MKRSIKRAAIAAVLSLLLVCLLAWVSTYHPRDNQTVRVARSSDAPMLKPGQKMKILTWNVQYMAGKGHVFFYDVQGNNGPDARPTTSEVSQTLQEVARVIRDESPDVILLQEIDDGSRRTDYRDELAELLTLLPSGYCCSASAFYHKAWFVPHPRIMGAVGMKLAVISKYQISAAVRHQLPLMPGDPLTQLFNFKRCVLETRLPVEGGGNFVALTTHLDAFAQGNNTMERQVAMVLSLLGSLDQQRTPWVIGGDFNLLPPGAYPLLREDQRYLFNKDSEIEPLFQHYQSVPNLLETGGGQRQTWFTHFPNDPKVAAPDRTIDYLFFSDNVTLGRHYVRQSDCLRISDHFPVVAEIKLPEAPSAAPRGKSEDIGSSLLP
jgi:endonuclease/exonuclease/phosphatase family metal-dependent hydrolase